MPNLEQFKTTEERNAWYRTYRKKNVQKLRDYNRIYNKNWRKKNGYHNERKWVVKYPKRVSAHSKLRYAVKIGKIVKDPCIKCGDIQSVGHHPNYDYPLEVIWLCRLHHREIHYGQGT